MTATEGRAAGDHPRAGTSKSTPRNAARGAGRNTAKDPDRDRPARRASDRSGESRSGWAATRGIGRDYKAALTAWLARPLTSFHLVLAVFGLLTAFGLVMVLSASSVQSFAEDGSSFVVFHRQLLYCVAGLALFWLGLRTPLRFMRRFSLAGLLVCLGLLVAVLTPLGSKINGARSWFTIGSLGSFQPSELAKLALAVWGAHVLVVKRQVLHRWRHLLIPVVPVALLMFALVMLQPDLGTTITMTLVLLALLWFAGAPLALFAVAAGGAAAGALALAGIADYRSDRLDAFLNPDTADPRGIGYQANQATFSLADGGWFGAGLGQGRAKWMYLPNAHNDFIFAIIGEELGLIGCLVVLALFATLAYVGLRIAARNTDPWNRLLAATLTTWLVGQAAINIGYVVGLLPVTGLPLPLISSGGTSLVVTMLVFGLLANLARHEPQSVSALQANGQGRVARLLGLPLPTPYRPPARRRAPARPAPTRTPQGRAEGPTPGRPARSWTQPGARTADRPRTATTGRGTSPPTPRGKDRARTTSDRARAERATDRGKGSAVERAADRMRNAATDRGRSPATDRTADRGRAWGGGAAEERGKGTGRWRSGSDSRRGGDQAGTRRTASGATGHDGQPRGAGQRRPQEQPRNTDERSRRW